jgi:purine-binding chemotaxis protein CheW
MSAPGAGDRSQYATFEVGGHYLGIKVLEVQEVLRQQQLTRVPLAPEVIAGLINLRGQIVPALEMRHVLRLPERPEGLETLSVVVRTEDGAVSLQVDEIGDVLELDGASFEPPPQNLEAHMRTLLLGVHKLKDRLLLVLDIHRAVDVGTAQSDGNGSSKRVH